MIHIISGHNFHGYYSVRIRAPKKGGQLSERQLNKISKELCGMSDCTCGGSYGDGPDENSAAVDQYGILHPVNCHCPEHT